MYIYFSMIDCGIFVYYYVHATTREPPILQTADTIRYFPAYVGDINTDTNFGMENLVFTSEIKKV